MILAVNFNEIHPCLKRHKMENLKLKYCIFMNSLIEHCHFKS